MPPARTPPELSPDGAPVSFLIDYDGTISRLDVGDALLERLFSDHALTASRDEEYERGVVGSRELMRWDMDVLPQDPELLRSVVGTIGQDEAFAPFVADVQAHGAAVEIVSDGLGFYIQSNLDRLGLGDLPIATNENALRGGGAGMSFPYGHPACFVCGTCKRERVRAHQALGNIVVFVGDGASDRYAAYHSDLVFAKEQLGRLCRENAWPYAPWNDFEDVRASVAAAFADGRLPSSRAEAATRRRTPGDPRTAPFICGPEEWGPDRTSPPG